MRSSDFSSKSEVCATNVRRENRFECYKHLNHAVTNARFASLRGLPVAPSPSRRRPLHFANRALVTSLHEELAARAAGFRLRLGGGVALRLRFARRSSPPSAPRSPLADRRPKPQLDFPRAIRRCSACRSNNSRGRATSAAKADSLGSAVRYSRMSNLLPKPSIA